MQQTTRGKKPKPVNDKPFQTIRDSVTTTGLSERYLRQLYREGKLPHVMVGNRVMVDVQALIDSVHRKASI